MKVDPHGGKEEEGGGRGNFRNNNMGRGGNMRGGGNRGGGNFNNPPMGGFPAGGGMMGAGMPGMGMPLAGNVGIMGGNMQGGFPRGMGGGGRGRGFGNQMQRGGNFGGGAGHVNPAFFGQGESPLLGINQISNVHTRLDPYLLTHLLQFAEGWFVFELFFLMMSLKPESERRLKYIPSALFIQKTVLSSCARCRELFHLVN